jgi:hypothetical protein
MKAHHFQFLSYLLAFSLALAACGPRKGMEGAGDPDSEASETTDSSASEEGKDSATGSGDTTTFTDEEEVEKVDAYIVQRGDNLWDIASKRSVYGSGWLYPLIVKANKDKIKDANDLKTGLTLNIPRGLSAGDYDVAREEAMAGVWEGPSAGLREGSDATTLANGGGVKPVEAPKKPESKGGMSIILWLLILLALAGGAWAWFKFKARKEQSQA